MNTSDDSPDAVAVPTSTYLTTRDAAGLLGVSVGTVLNMVERGHLDAWRTEGGHRRINMNSVLSQLARRQGGTVPSPIEGQSQALEVLVIEDDQFLQTIYREQLADWNLPLRLRFADNGVEGLIELGRAVPDLLLIDLSMPVMDGFTVLRILRDRPGFEAMDIIAITGLNEAQIMSAGGLPPGILVWRKPIPFEQLRGFLDARLIALQRDSRQ